MNAHLDRIHNAGLAHLVTAVFRGKQRLGHDPATCERCIDNDLTQRLHQAIQRQRAPEPVEISGEQEHP